MKAYIERLILLLIVFYYIYPQALNTFGSSFIILPGILGLGLYIYHRFPFKEVIYLLTAYLTFVFVVFITSYVNMVDDTFIFAYSKSQAAWFFSAYLITFLLFKFHKTPTPVTVASYIMCAVLLQCICTVLIYASPEAKDFLTSLELQVELTEAIRDEVEGTRLVGYGIGFFGAGFIAGYGLIFTMFVITQTKLKKKQLLFLCLIYVFIFYIGVLSARTTIVGCSVSIVLLLILYFKNYRQLKSKVSIMLVSFVLLVIIGSSIIYAYFPSMTSWAFELFTNFTNKGTLETKSSDGIKGMFIFPDDFHTFIFGNNNMNFFGSDVGYTRMAFYCGVIGLVLFYSYALIIALLSFSKDKNTNILLLLIVIYGLALNIKGLTDMHSILYLFFMFFMFYKYYIYRPKIYRQNLELRTD